VVVKAGRSGFNQYCYVLHFHFEAGKIMWVLQDTPGNAIIRVIYITESNKLAQKIKTT
jgi:hypothetical protein